MSEENKAVVQAFVDAFKRGELPAALELLAEDGIVDEAGGMQHSGVFTGGGKGFAALVEIMSKNMDARIDEDELIDAGDVVVSKMLLTFTSKRTGRSAKVKVTELYTVFGGKITFLDSYYKNPAAVLAIQTETE
jgi:ketosteroid isomerase-like protein